MATAGSQSEFFSDFSSSVTARWVFPVDASPIEHGVIEIEAGQIVAIAAGRSANLTRQIDLGNVAVIPGLVNAHAHLEFASLDRAIAPPSPFTEWIRQLLAHRRQRGDRLSEWIRAGSQEARNSGTTLVGDIATGNWFPELVPNTGPQTVAFRELIGLRPEQADAQLAIAERHIADCRTNGRIVPALSPHAPYSVSLDLFHRLVRLAASERVPLCVHLAETPAELEILKSGSGEMVEMLSGFGIWDDTLIPRGTRPLDFLEPLTQVETALVAHGNYLGDDDVGWLAAHPQVATIYCPRTHHYFQHPRHPWRRLIEAGASVCLGTDGRSSNPDYSLWNELLFLDRLTDGACRPLLLELGTLRGARALGLGQQTGSLTVGKRADLAVIPLPDRDGSDPWPLLFASNSVAMPLNQRLRGLDS